MRRNLKLMTMAAAVIVAAASLTFGGVSGATDQPVPTTSTPKTIARSQADIDAWNAAVHRDEVRRYITAVKFQILARHHEAELWRRFVAHLRAEAARKAYPHGLCGGDLPPCYVMMRESRGDIRARNPRSSASGKWQFIRGTWAGFGGYSDAYLAPEKVQDAKARQLWAGGRGCGHWNAC